MFSQALAIVSGLRQEGGTALPCMLGSCKDPKSGQVADPTALPAKGSSGPPLLTFGLITHSTGQASAAFVPLLSSVKLLSCESFALDLRTQMGLQSRVCTEMPEGCE